MRIKTRYYYHDKGSSFIYGGRMVLKNRYIVSLGRHPVESEGRPFYFDSTFHTIAFEGRERKGTVDANWLITEADYGRKQHEYLVRLTWFQQQKLMWMFRRHWLQQPGNVVHIAILGLIVTLTFMGFEYIHHKF